MPSQQTIILLNGILEADAVILFFGVMFRKAFGNYRSSFGTEIRFLAKRDSRTLLVDALPTLGIGKDKAMLDCCGIGHQSTIL